MSASGPPLAEVAIALPVDGTFHYLVTGDLNPRVSPGTRVLVPFRARRVTGYVLDRPNRTDPALAGLKLKKIIQPLDEEPLFSPDMIPLFRFAAEYYHYPLGLVIAEALPAGLKVMSHRAARLTPDGRRALKLDKPALPEAALMARLDRPHGLTLSRLAKENGEALKLVRRIEAKGWLVIETHLGRDRVRAGTQRWLIPLPPEQATPARLGPREK
ncbi:MAG: hypothetical protein SV487_13355, partial [Thermodesulfobacteriota bacterium]|nr:hypothetical protein [Thermodesulfobacteriota bacterium]